MDLFRQFCICFCFSRIWTCSDSVVCFCFSRIWTCSDSGVCFCFSRIWICSDSVVCFCFSRIWTCSDSVVYVFGFLEYGPVPTAWYVFVFHLIVTMNKHCSMNLTLVVYIKLPRKAQSNISHYHSLLVQDKKKKIRI